MTTDEQLIARFLAFFDEPDAIAGRHDRQEQVTGERLRAPEYTSAMQLQQLLDDEQMHELVEQMAFAKRAFKNEETLTEELSVADEWEQFASGHAEALDALEEDEAQPHLSFRKMLGAAKRQRRVAASFVGVLLASAVALAAIHIWGLTPGPSLREREVYGSATNYSHSKSGHSPLPENETGGEASVIFDNVPLDTMLTEMASYYHVSVAFEREEARQLRFHFVWKRTDDLDRLVEKLNNFEAINIFREPETLIVK